MIGTHDYRLVALAIFLAFAASYTALDLTSRTLKPVGIDQASDTRWLWAGAAILGGGIWSMHFVAMLAFAVPEVSWGYDPWLTALSLGLAIVATGVGFRAVDRTRSLKALFCGGLFMGTGITTMHYVGMAAIIGPVGLSFDLGYVAASFVIAVAAAVAALRIASGSAGLAARLVGSALMALAISGMHFTGMMAADFSPAEVADVTVHAAHIGKFGLALGVGLTAVLTLIVALTVSALDRRAASLRQAEASAARAQEEMVRSLYRRTPLPLHATDTEGTILEASEAWLDLLGLIRADVMGRPFAEFLNAASRRQFVERDLPALLAAGQLEQAEYEMERKEGAPIVVQCSAFLERLDGIQPRISWGLVDVTARRRAEADLRRAQRMDAMGQLSGGVAHDFNNVLAVIQGNLEHVKLRLSERHDIVARLNNALDSTRRGALLTQRMLAFARKQTLSPEPLDLHEMLTELHDLLQKAAGPTRRLDNQVAEGRLSVRVDRNQLELALINLVVNARDASEDGSVITIAARREMGMADGMPTAFCVLGVIDSGSGMDDLTLQRATEPFFTTKGLNQGSGLGLSMVHGFAEQSGGFLRLDSTLGAGTRAEIWLPEVPAVSEAKPAAAEGMSSVTSRTMGDLRKVLAVDDDVLVLMSTVTMLEDLGLTVIEATSGRTALALLDQHKDIDLLVTDQMMPEMTGLELAERVRLRWPAMPILVATGYLDLQQSSSLQLPVLNKPFGPQDLTDSINNCLARHEGTAESIGVSA